MRIKLLWIPALAFGMLGAGHAAAATQEGQEGTAMVGSPAAADMAGIATDTTLLADEDQEAKDASDWQFALTSYVWASGMSGDVELAPGESVDVDTSFTDILSVLKFALMGAAEARHGRFVLLGDLIFLKISEKESGPAGYAKAKVDSTTLLTNFAAGYRLVDRDSLYLDVFGGGQFALLDIGVDLSGPLRSVERDKSKSKISPLIGTRFRAPLGGRWGLLLYGDAAGWGLTTHRSWQLMGTVQYQLTDRIRLAAGYRHVSVKVDKDGFKIDLGMSGPILGFTHFF
jgi:hypothetical protein